MRKLCCKFKGTLFVLKISQLKVHKKIDGAAKSVAVVGILITIPLESKIIYSLVLPVSYNFFSQFPARRRSV